MPIDRRTFAFLSAQISSLEDSPHSWGTKEAVERQYRELLVLGEVCDADGDPTIESIDARRMLLDDRWCTFLEKRGYRGPTPLWSREGVTMAELINTLREFREAFRRPEPEPVTTEGVWVNDMQMEAGRWVDRTGAEAAVILVVSPHWAPESSTGAVAGSARCPPDVARHYIYDAALKMLKEGTFVCSYANCAVCRARDGKAAN